jgi:sugar (pentulose or hexulose) kinase
MPELGKKGFEDLVAACDAGTSGVRCALFDTKGNIAASAHRLWSYEPDPGATGGLMFDPESAWNLMASVICEAIDSGGIRPARIRAVSVTSQRLGLVLVDILGNGIKGIPNIDRRAVTQAAMVGEKWGKLVYSRAGRWPGPGHALNKLLWIKEYEPEIFNRTASVLSLGDWFALRMGGQVATDPSSACETCLYDVVGGGWDPEISGATSVEASILPKIIPCGSPVGQIGRKISCMTGLPEGALIVMGGGDTECGVLGLGARRAGDMAIIAGSSAPIECVVDSPIMDSEYRTLTNPFVIEGKWVVESNAMLTGSSYGWLVSILSPPGASPDPSSRYADIEREIAATEIGAGGALCYLGSSIMDSRRGNFPAVAGILAPMSAVNGRSLTRGHLVRAALEAEAYAIRANIEQLVQVTGFSSAVILVGGGSLKSDAFRSILPDVLGIPVLSTDDEATPRGCAMCAAAGAGYFGTLEEACASMAPRPAVLEPDIQRHVRYDLPYRRWLSGFGQIKALDIK